MRSEANKINIEDLKRRGKDVLIFLGPIVLLTFDNIDKLDNNELVTMFFTLCISAGIDLLRRYLSNNTKNG